MNKDEIKELIKEEIIKKLTIKHKWKYWANNDEIELYYDDEFIASVEVSND